VANYIPRWRTNYFKVKNGTRFKEWVDSFYGDYEIRMKRIDDETYFMIMGTGEDGCPWNREFTREEAKEEFYNNPEGADRTISDEENINRIFDEGDTEIDFHVYEELAEHLTDDCVACGVEVGHKKMRYLTGVAAVTDSSGKVEYVSLNNWAAKTAADKWPGKKYTDPEY